MKQLTPSRRLAVSLIACLLAVFSYGTANAQKTRGLSEAEKQAKRDSIINNSDYIFRGGGGGTPMKFVGEDNKVYAVCNIQVSEVLRGPQEMKNKFFYFVVNNPSERFIADDPYEKFQKIPDYVWRTDVEGVGGGYYFCKKNTHSIDRMMDTQYVWRNSPALYYPELFNPQTDLICEPTSTKSYGINDWLDNDDDISNDMPYGSYKGLYQKYFEDQQAVYDFLRPYGNIYEAPAETEKKQNSSRLKSEGEGDKIVTPEEQAAFELWMQGGVKRSVQKSSLKADEENTVDCEFGFDHQHLVSENGKLYYVFDLTVQYTSSTESVVYPENILLYFKYNMSALGSGIVTSGKLTLEQNTDLFPALYYNFDSRDHVSSAGQALIRMSARYDELGYYDGDYHFLGHRTAIATNTQEPVKLGRVKIEVSVANLGKPVGIAELWDKLELNINTWTAEAGCYSCFDFANTTLKLNDSYILGRVSIESVEAVNGGPISGGTGCKVRVTGSGFMNGDKKLDGFIRPPVIMMKNANGRIADGQVYYDYVPVDWTDIDFATWNDTNIEFTMPSIVYGTQANEPPPTINSVPVGTSQIKVRNQVGREAISKDPVKVEYSVMNMYNDVSVYNTGRTDYGYTGKQRPYWSRVNCSEQILFTFNTAVADRYIKAMEQACDEWNKALGFPFLGLKRDAAGAVVRTSTVTGSINDQYNLVYYGTDGLASVPVQVVTGRGANRDFLIKCGTDYSRTQIDMSINNARCAEATDLKLKQILMHELGHGLGLDHIINEADLMTPIIPDKITAAVSAGAQAGADRIITDSKNKSWGSSCTTLKPLLSKAGTCPAAVPTYVKATAQSKTEMLIEWLTSPLNSSYILIWSLNADMSASQQITIAGGSTKSYLQSGLTSNTRYYYQLKAVNPNGTSLASYTVNDKTKLISLFRSVENITVENVNAESTKLQWTDGATDETNYIIERKPVTTLKSSGEYNVIAVLDANTTEFYDYSVQEGATYEYRIKYVTATGVSNYSADLQTTVGEYSTHTAVLPLSRSAALYNNTYYLYTNTANTNYANHPELRAWRWTQSGLPTYYRSLLDFDLSQIPQDAIIEEAVLVLKSATHINDVTNGSPTYKPNASWLEVVTQPWDATQVTWNTQPASSATYRVALANAATASQDYSVYITDLVRKMVSDPVNTHGLMFRLQNETAYTRMFFGSQANADESLHPVLTVRYVTAPEHVLQVNVNKDAVIYKSQKVGNEYIANSYYGDNERIIAETWTNGGWEYSLRGLLDINISSIPSSATITDARLNLYSPRPQSSNSDKQYSTLSTGSSTYQPNDCFLSRIVAPWDENSVTWNNQPATRARNSVSLAQSSAYLQDYLNIDIKNVMQDMVQIPDSAFGLMLKLNTESIYRRMSFASSDHPDVRLHPNATIKYKVYPSLLKSGSEISIASAYESARNINIKTQPDFIDSLTQVSVSIAPNPTKGQVTVTSANDEISSITLYNTSNVQIKHIDLQMDEQYQYILDLSMYAKGAYFVEINSKRGKHAQTILLE